MMGLDGLQVVRVDLDLMQRYDGPKLSQLAVQQLDYRLSPTVTGIAFELTQLSQLLALDPLVLRNQPM